MMDNPASEVLMITCPQCRAQIQGHATHCPTCGMDLNLMTMLAERELMAQTAGRTEAAERPPVSIEALVPRLGDYLVWNGYISQDQLQTALTAQAAQTARGPRHLLGRTLVKMGLLSEEKLDQAITEQVLELQEALLKANRDLEKRVTERTAELEAALTRLAEFNQLKANLVANISHELRTPLTHIKGYNVLMRQGDLGPVTEDQESALEVTARSIERLEQLINDLISFSAASKGELSLKLKPTSPTTMLQAVLQAAAPKAQERQVRLVQQIGFELPLVMADEEKLIWTLAQLVDNSLKFTPPHGQVTLSALAEEGWVRFAVQDTGIGIPPERQDDIFEPFRQLDGSSTRRYGGTGLGLSLVRRIVEAHGATIKVESQVSQGSTFSFALPRARTSENNAES